MQQARFQKRTDLQPVPFFFGDHQEIEPAIRKFRIQLSATGESRLRRIIPPDLPQQIAQLIMQHTIIRTQADRPFNHAKPTVHVAREGNHAAIVRKLRSIKTLLHHRPHPWIGNIRIATP
ncbi:MAG: hypothetical protein BWY82_01975 [Verrucomicrobia bacterium ADurb.Bin474]|nr:MAG: hypothetical protein BWY82_01975 [Verrucomicrobia bacterium ADurb.Bin474]